MAASKNLLTSRKSYSKYYGNFRGVDFSSDHTNVADSRFAYAVNMYRDYQSGQGVAIETIPGYRRIEFDSKYDPTKFGYTDSNSFDDDTIYGVHHYTFKKYISTDGPSIPGTDSVLFIHKGIRLYIFAHHVLPSDVSKLYIDMDVGYKFEGATVDFCSYGTGVFMAQHKSVSFCANNTLYILDGSQIICVESNNYDTFKISKIDKTNAFIPTVYAGLKPNMTVEEITECEVNQANLLTPYVKFTFVADGVTKRFDFPISSEGVTGVKVYGKEIDLDSLASCENDYIEFSDDNIPLSPERAEHEEGYAGIEVTVEANLGLNFEGQNFPSDAITGCTLFATYDNRIFLSGNPLCPNHVYWCGFTNGYVDPTYWGILNYTVDGVGYSPITGLMVVADALMVLKADTDQEGAVYYHTPKESGIPIAPTIYPSVRGLSGIGCLGACVNFLDDPVFVSRLGLEGIRTLSIMYERNIEHRSSLIDVKLRGVTADAKLAEWDGYLLLLSNGNLFLADSRQKYTDSIGVVQYEWYWVESLGMWKGQVQDYKFSTVLPPDLENITVEGALGDTRTLSVAEYFYDEVYETFYDARGMSSIKLNYNKEIPRERIYSAEVELNGKYITVWFTDYGADDDHFFLLELQNYYVKGDFVAADNVYAFSNKNGTSDIYFTANGRLFKFNFDMRKEDGSFPRKAYSFDNRIIVSGVATKMDNCGIPGYTKNTVKKSTVIKTKSLVSSAAKIKVRTNKDPYKQIDRIQSGYIDFNDVDFSDFTFATEGDTLFNVQEKEKKWVEKQYYIYSDEYEKPFSLYYIGYDYTVAGRYKENK